MDSKKFWRMIDEARQRADSWVDMMEPLIDSLEQLDEPEIFVWQHIFDEYQRLSYKNKLWAAAYVINGGCSNDGFDYFRAWLTAQGKDVFLSSLLDPETLVDADISSEYSEFEEIMGTGARAYFIKLGIDPDYGRFYEEFDKHPLTDSQKAEIASEIEFAPDMDKQWEENDLDKWLPKLCEICK